MQFTDDERESIRIAKNIIGEKFAQYGDLMSSPHATRDFLKLHLAVEESEVFSVMFLTSQHALIAVEDLFHGTIDGSAVYPREVAKAALSHNAAAVILCHNHPSGQPEPSQADIRITKRLVEALKLIDVRVLDHMIVAGNESTSLAEQGLI